MNRLIAYIFLALVTYSLMYVFVSVAMLCFYPGAWSVLDVLGTTRIILGIIAAWSAWTQIKVADEALQEILEGKYDRKWLAPKIIWLRLILKSSLKYSSGGGSLSFPSKGL